MGFPSLSNTLAVDVFENFYYSKQLRCFCLPVISLRERLHESQPSCVLHPLNQHIELLSELIGSMQRLSWWLLFS